MKILFQGDSITDTGRSRDEKKPNIHLGNGYVSMIAGQLIAENPDAGYEIYNRGVSGNRIGDTYARWLEDAVRMDFDLLSILSGVNDVGFHLRMNRGSDPDRFESIYDLMLKEAVESHPNARIILVEPFIFRFPIEPGMASEDICRDWDLWKREIHARGDRVEKLAKKYGALFVPMFDHFESLCAKHDPRLFSLDCIHLTPAGNHILAQRWLETARRYCYI